MLSPDMLWLKGHKASGALPHPASFMAVAALEIAATELQAALEQVSSELRRARRQKRARDEGPREWLQHRLRGYLRRLVLTMFQLADHDPQVPADFLHGHGRKRRRVHVAGSILDTRTAVEDLYLGTEAAELVDLLTPRPDCPAWQACQVEAARYVVDHRLFHWLLQQNCEKGVAPTTRALLGQLPLQLPVSLDVGLRGMLLQGLSTHCLAGRQWACRWRSRWGVRLGRLPPRRPLTTHEMQQRETSRKFASRPGKQGICLSQGSM